ncbi:uncharacterized protein Ecym_5162 [Eremothecium cymbalariae DBVPG|uniref:Uncharacterized protein n=1 Tax=Eremothecium cymbalariae (strain CBS 270.75 / DBVPG 7215 / KCTC 17166 / NRRL Y-17582) TaxID=931890 RepID=I6NCZ5_ERECY|nr:hypothetical protein Ecym_5162 [Eremothecium cymbalariae DBVPG\
MSRSHIIYLFCLQLKTYYSYTTSYDLTRLRVAQAKTGICQQLGWVSISLFSTMERLSVSLGLRYVTVATLIFIAGIVSVILFLCLLGMLLVISIVMPSKAHIVLEHSSSDLASKELNTSVVEFQWRVELRSPFKEILARILRISTVLDAYCCTLGLHFSIFEILDSPGKYANSHVKENMNKTILESGIIYDPELDDSTEEKFTNIKTCHYTEAQRALLQFQRTKSEPIVFKYGHPYTVDDFDDDFEGTFDLTILEDRCAKKQLDNDTEYDDFTVDSSGKSEELGTTDASTSNFITHIMPKVNDRKQGYVYQLIPSKSSIISTALSHEQANAQPFLY